ncbi:hypothetical protein J8273_8390 [Carpediemonas membranifera]|uniref:Uncharacterized protein n=1 Tax=Carpediemonas membranifera TaxID=201153 RepID=A0A8J6APB9_9EUKA|nr:hypothetical protein J8273_8390 [Carpediemonas membranifera]|eukprot:KAG9389716.1 hypothetical protein J8273_8390 [Carpediemonas membranifera]
MSDMTRTATSKIHEKPQDRHHQPPPSSQTPSTPPHGAGIGYSSPITPMATQMTASSPDRSIFIPRSPLTPYAALWPHTPLDLMCDAKAQDRMLREQQPLCLQPDTADFMLMYERLRVAEREAVQNHSRNGLQAYAVFRPDSPAPVRRTTLSAEMPEPPSARRLLFDDLL